MTAAREGAQVDTLPQQNYVKKSDGTVVAMQGDDSGNLMVVQGFSIAGHDYVALTYVAAGNGVGEVETATYKTGGSGGTTLATLTLTYDSSNRIATVTKT